MSAEERDVAEALERFPPAVAPATGEAPAAAVGLGTGGWVRAPPAGGVVGEAGCVAPAAALCWGDDVGSVAALGFEPGLFEGGELEGGAGTGDQAICWAARGRESTSRQEKTRRLRRSKRLTGKEGDWDGGGHMASRGLERGR